jgi:hypothetical protein
MKDDKYWFHQTPAKLAADLIEFVPIIAGDSILEPFKGEGAFYNSFPDHTNKIYSEIEEGIDYRDLKTEHVDWVITNPPFKLPDQNGKMKNSIFPLLVHYSLIAKKGIAFLVSDYALNSLTTRRLQKMKETGFYLKQMIVCGAKKWRGRYYFLIFTKEPCNFMTGLLTTY